MYHRNVSFPIPFSISFHLHKVFHEKVATACAERSKGMNENPQNLYTISSISLSNLWLPISVPSLCNISV